MKKLILDLINSETVTSSSRFINLVGFIAMTIWITWHIYNKELTYDILAVYATYCAGGYIGGKYLNNREESNARSDIEQN